MKFEEVKRDSFIQKYGDLLGIFKYIAIGFASLMVLLALGLIVMSKVMFGPIPYEKEGWMRGRRERSQTCLKMVGDLLKKHPLEGKTQEEVEDLIGETNDQKSDFPHCSKLYRLGKIFPVDSQWLCIEYKDDVVTKASVVID